MLSWLVCPSYYDLICPWNFDLYTMIYLICPWSSYNGLSWYYHIHSCKTMPILFKTMSILFKTLWHVLPWLMCSSYYDLMYLLVLSHTPGLSDTLIMTFTHHYASCIFSYYIFEKYKNITLENYSLVWKLSNNILWKFYQSCWYEVLCSMDDLVDLGPEIMNDVLEEDNLKKLWEKFIKLWEKFIKTYHLKSLAKKLFSDKDFSGLTIEEDEI